MMHTDKLLSSQNIDVLSLIPGGCANKEIGAKHFITEETTKGHTKSIFNDLAPTSASAATDRGTWVRRFGSTLVSSGRLKAELPD